MTPNGLRSIPFGRSSTCEDKLEITEAQLECVVALMAAQRLGYDGATAEALASLAEVSIHATQSYLTVLKKKGWAVQVGKVGKFGQRMVWAASPRAWRQLGEKLERVGE